MRICSHAAQGFNCAFVPLRDSPEKDAMCGSIRTLNPTFDFYWNVVTGAVDSRHAFLNMRDLEVKASPHTRAGRTCPPAMGFSFAAGTTDGAPLGLHPMLRA